MRRILITGGAGFIGSNLTRYILSRYRDCMVTVLDTVECDRGLENLSREIWENSLFSFWQGDIKDEDAVNNIMRHADVVIHLAAGAGSCALSKDLNLSVDKDLRGTQVLLEAVRRNPVETFIHVSTSEVYGSAEKLPVTEEHPLLPQSPFAGGKTGADRLAYSYCMAYKLPVVIIRPFSCYGPRQAPENVIPLLITNALLDKQLPVYGDGSFAGDWLYVEDLCAALDRVLHIDIEKLRGEVINIGTGVEIDLKTVAQTILEALGKSESLVKFVENELSQMGKLVSSTSKCEVLLGWKAKVSFYEGIRKTVDWYVKNKGWWMKLKDLKHES